MDDRVLLAKLDLLKDVFVLFLVKLQVVVRLLLRGQVLDLARSDLIVAHFCCLLLRGSISDSKNFGVGRVVELVFRARRSVRRLGVAEGGHR